MSKPWMENLFPGLGPHTYQVTSDPADYNCIAWAAGDSATWWSHLDGYYWPGRTRDATIESLVAVFTDMGYSQTKVRAFEDGIEKVALYSQRGLWTHAARQLPNGRWTSKLGPDEDIEHATPESLEGEFYGTVFCIMGRRQS